MRTILIVGSLLSFASVVAAQPALDPSTLSDEQRDELGRLFNRAQSAYQAENYLEAIEALQAAHAIFGEPNILYRIGDAYENLGDLGKAAEFYRRYADAAPGASDAGLVRRRVDDLERRAAELERRLEATQPERAALLLDSNPAGALVRLDDRAVEGETPVRVELAPGNHRIELQRDGYLSIVRDIRIDAGETISLVYQLEREPTPPPPAKRSAWPWVVSAAGIASIGTSAGLFFASRAAGQKVDAWDAERIDAYQSGGEVLPRPDRYDTNARSQVVFRNAGFVTGGIGAAALVTGTIWLLVRPTKTEDLALSFDHRSVTATLRF